MRKITHILIFILTLAALLLSACGRTPPATTAPASGNSVPEATPAGTTELQGNIAISGAFALYPMVTRWAEEFQKIHPKVTFDISGGGAGKGMTDALSGAVDIGMVSRSVKPEEEAQGAYAVAVVKDAVFPMINANNPVINDIKIKGITKEIFGKIYLTGEIKTWGEVVGKPEVTDEIHVYTRSDASGAGEMWAKFVGGQVQDDLKGIGVNADPGLLEAVMKDPLGIGYNNLGYAFDLSTGKPVAGALPVPIDINNNGSADPDEIADTQAKAVELIATGKYPSPPAREENLVTKGKPSGLVREFILWVLTDGQQYVGEAGYVQLTPEQLEAFVNKVK
jgi:phosphate transport system substrate-binding protein